MIGKRARWYEILVVVVMVLMLASPMPTSAATPDIAVGPDMTISTVGGTGPRMNGHSFQQDAIASHNGWQYAAFYVDVTDGRRLAISRRPLPTTGDPTPAWSAPIVFNDYLQTTDDSHNVVSMGISPADGRIHLAFDMHACQPGPDGGPNQFNYRVSVAGLTTNPSGHSWVQSKFGPVNHSLGGVTFPLESCGSGPSVRVTYPRFVTKPDGSRLLFSIRRGVPGAGDEHLYAYTAGSWNEVGKYIEGTAGGFSAYSYLNGLDYGPGNRLHATWVWRENQDLANEPDVYVGSQLNHDLMYAYSDDDGATWHNRPLNSADQEHYVTNVAPILPTSKVKVWDIPQGTCLLNQEGQTIDGAGRVHVLLRHTLNPVDSCANTAPPPGEEVRWAHYFTGVNTNTWSRRLMPSAWRPTGRGKIVAQRIGTVDHVFAILPGQGIAASAVVSGDQWELVDATTVPPDPLYDRNWLKASGHLAVLFQRGSRVYSQEWDLAP